MPASLPGSSLASNLANPADGIFVMFDPLSGPKGSPFDKDVQVDIVTGAVTPRGGCSTGALATGIGYSTAPIFGPPSPKAIADAGFTDDYIPGQSTPGSVDTGDSTWVYIGGGRSDKNVDGLAPTNPYPTGITPLCGAGTGTWDGVGGSSRDGGAGPAFTGFPVKTVTATGAVAIGAAIEAGWVNRSARDLVAGESAFGSAVTPALPTAP
jgi:hypothetical protein